MPAPDSSQTESQSKEEISKTEQKISNDLTQTENNVLEQVATVVKKTINNEAVNVIVSLEEKTLKIILETNQFLDGQALTKDIHAALQSLSLGPIKQAKIYKQKPKNTYSFLLKELSLEKIESSTINQEQPVALNGKQPASIQDTTSSSRSVANSGKKKRVLKTSDSAIGYYRCCDRCCNSHSSNHPINLVSFFTLWLVWSGYWASSYVESLLFSGTLVQHMLSDD